MYGFYGFFLNEKNVYVKDTFHVFLTYKLILLIAPSNLKTKACL